MRFEDVAISDPVFLVTNVMKDCPARTVIRELLQNAIEAASGRRIEWFRFDWKGTLKLGLYNEGPGMDYRELSERMNIASSGKKLGIRDNFGMGAKMSAARASPYGLLYRSCKSGIVSEIWIQAIDQPNGGKRLVKVEQYDQHEGEWDVVRQVTDDAVARGRTLDRDWTEAVLLGRTPEDGTLSGEFLGEASVLWLMQAINQRYYRFPPNVVVRSATITSSRRDDGHRNARGLEAILADSSITERKETVVAPHDPLGPLHIVYGKLAGAPRDRKSGPLAADGLSGGTHVCLVWRNEVYDLDRQKWLFQAGAYGFSGVAEDYYIHICLPDFEDDDRISNTNHRTNIQDASSQFITCERFCNLVREHRPQWVLDDIRSRLEVQNTGRLQDRLRRLADRLKAKMDTPVVLPGEGHDAGAVELDYIGSGGEGEGEGVLVPVENGRYTRRGFGKRQPRPRLDTLMADFRKKDDAPAWYEAMKGRAGAYDKGDNTIWLSEDFCEYIRLIAWVGQQWPAMEENGLAISIVREEYCYFAGAYGLAALSFRRDEDWSPDQWEKGLTPEALSCHLRDPSGVVQTAALTQIRSKLSSRIREQAAR